MEEFVEKKSDKRKPRHIYQRVKDAVPTMIGYQVWNSRRDCRCSSQPQRAGGRAVIADGICRGRTVYYLCFDSCGQPAIRHYFYYIYSEPKDVPLNMALAPSFSKYSLCSET